MWYRIRNNPALLIGAVEALLALAVTFGADLTPEQTGAVLAALVALGSIAVRQSVHGPLSHEAKVERARVEGPLPEQTDNREILADGPQPPQHPGPLADIP